MSRASDARPALPTSLADLAPLAEAFWLTLNSGLSAIGLDLGAAERQALAAHARLLIAWNAHINLSGLRTPDAIARGHVLDALIAVPTLRRLIGRPASVLDLGSGGGYPGLPVAICLPATRLALVDSIAKKAAFLTAAAALVSEELPSAPTEQREYEALAQRAEVLARDPNQRERWDLVTARAVGSVSELAELGLPLVQRGGWVVAWKLDDGDGSLAREVKSAAPICRAAGGEEPQIVALEGTAEAGLQGHCLVVIAKSGSTPARYPRAVGERRRSALR